MTKSMSAEPSTLLLEGAGPSLALRVPRFVVEVVAGPEMGKTAHSVDGRLSVGTADGSGLRLIDPTVSNYHLDFEATNTGVVVRDLGSTNHTLFEGALVHEIVLTQSAVLDVGRSRIQLRFEHEGTKVELGAEARFGRLIGHSPVMRLVFAMLARAAPTTAPVLITGESGTGKELAARALHDASPRAQGPFEVVDCAGLPSGLIESELFGHERGAFTDALGERAGAFERAEGGTIFLDELGELPLELQPKLLRVLGEGEIRRVGGKRTKRIDVRVVAATNRDLRRDVNSGQFRADLYYRLAVIQVRMPSLRERQEDLPALVAALAAGIVTDLGLDTAVVPDARLLETLARHSWPGNVRELRNYLERLIILQSPLAMESFESFQVPAGADPSDESVAGSMTEAFRHPAFDELEKLPLRVAKADLAALFERRYVEHLLRATGGNIAEAARRAGVDRATLFRSVRRYQLVAKPKSSVT